MRVLRSVFAVVFFVLGVFVASANIHDVELIYLPAVGVLGMPAPLSVSVPLFLVVLSALVIGVLLGGLAAIMEQARLRLGLRRARKDAARALEERGKAEALLDNATAETAGLAAEIAELREELAAAGESETAKEPLSAFLDSAEGQVSGESESGSGDLSSDEGSKADRTS
jgi:uncharacterized integral membrane protein